MTEVAPLACNPRPRPPPLEPSGAPQFDQRLALCFAVVAWLADLHPLPADCLYVLQLYRLQRAPASEICWRA